jgi:transcriptional regulator of PTS gene
LAIDARLDIYPLIGNNITTHFREASIIIPMYGKNCGSFGDTEDGRSLTSGTGRPTRGAGRRIARETGMDTRFTIDEIFADIRVRRTDLAKARIFFAVFKRGQDGTRTRRSLSQDLSLRPATVSAMVGELIEDGLIAETDRTAATGKGRPEASLQLQATRVVTVAIEVTSRTIRGVLVDLEGRTVGEASLAIEEDQAEQANLMAAFKAVARDVLAQRPAGADIPGVGIALPGIVDERGLTWISAARWPRMTNLDFHGLAEETGLIVRIERKRQAEARAHFRTHPAERSGSTLSVTWGYGISSAYAQNGMVLSSSMGGFGDLGHWLVEPENGRKCLCGQSGCLEAHAALWALMPEIRKAFPDIGTHPPTIRALLRSRDISDLPGIEHATRLFALSLHNLFKTFFPDRIVLSGYFPENPWICERVRRLFFANMPHYARGRVTLEVKDPNADDAVIGVSTPFFQESLRPFLLARDVRI